MQDNDLQGIIDSISEKVGKENSALIADDIGKLITINSSVVDDLKKKDNEISRLTQTNEKLIIANGNLLQSIPLGKEEKKKVTQTICDSILKSNSTLSKDFKLYKLNEMT